MQNYLAREHAVLYLAGMQAVVYLLMCSYWLYHDDGQATELSVAKVSGHSGSTLPLRFLRVQ